MKRARLIAAGLAMLVLFCAICAAIGGLPHFGESRGIGDRHAAQLADGARHVTNLDSFVNFDFRGMDTLGEEYLVFVTVCGLSLLLRDTRGKRAPESMPAAPGRVIVQRSELIRWFAPWIVGSGIVVGCGTVMHGQLTPGGGFQGGVTIASIVATVWFAYGYRVWNQLTDAQRVEPVEALGAAGYALTGIASIVIGGAAFLQNVAPLGRSGAVISGGTIWIVNTCVGIEVTAAFIVLIVEFVHDTRRVVP